MAQDTIQVFGGGATKLVEFIFRPVARCAHSARTPGTRWAGPCYTAGLSSGTGPAGFAVS